MRFAGDDYKRERDDDRLGRQISRVWQAMKDGKWHTLPELESLTGDPAPSISAQLRHMRKPRFGGHTIDRRYIANGLYEYRLANADTAKLGSGEGP